jgi:uncharacterized membrane protein
MTTFDSSKILAGIGSIILGTIVGIILFMIGMKGLSEHYKDRRIYDGLINGGILLIISFCLFWVGAATIIILVGIPLIIVGFILAILSVKHIRNCFHALAERSGEHLFQTAGTLIWVGALLSIILIGFALIWIGFIIAAIGFFTLKDNAQPPTAYNYTAPPSQNNYAPPPPPQNTQPSNFCPNCGAQTPQGTTFCSNCGKQI